MLQKLLFWLKISRPGLWFATIWLYILPTSQQMEVWTSPAFWFGLFYVCFPLNLMVYGWNDIVDREADALNPRKDNYFFGARASKEQLATLWKAILGTQLVCLPFLYYFMGPVILFLLMAFVGINGLYNLPKNGLRSMPPLELLCQIGYLLIVPLSIFINNTEALPLLSYGYLLLFAFQSHLIGEVMDIEPDRAAKKYTTATKLGIIKTKLLIIALVTMEVSILVFVFKDLLFGGMLAIGLIWLLLDVLLIYRNKQYTMKQMKLFSVLSNLVAFVSMAYVWYSGCLLSLPS